MEKMNFFSSWSGGKDSALAFYKAVQSGGVPKMLLTMFEETGERSRSHALPPSIMDDQAKSIGLPLLMKNSSWASYEQQFLAALSDMKKIGITHGVFGDIDLEDHLKWVQDTCAKADVIAEHPLWLMPRKSVLEEFLHAGFEAYIIVVDHNRMSSRYLGKQLTFDLIEELEKEGIDPCGESGEFHTVVVDGPIFDYRIQLKFTEIVENEGYTFLKAEL